MQFSKAIQGFIFYLNGANYSSVTIQYYEGNLRRIQKALGDPPVETITADQLREFLAGIPHSNATKQVYWKIIRSFYKWASVEIGIPDASANIPAPVAVSKAIIPFSQQDIQALLKSTKSKRNRAMIMFLLDSGVRVSEMCRLTILDVDLTTGMVKINPFQTGKKSRPRVVYLGSTARRYLWQYISSRPDTEYANAPLFATHTGKPLNRCGVRDILRRLASTANVPNVHPHRFRHTFAIQYLRNGGDVFTLQRLLGHSSLHMVRHYLNLSDTDTQASHSSAISARKMPRLSPK